MNTTVTRTVRQTTPPHDQLPVLRPTRRAGLLDRAALHLGVALIRWGRRPGRELARYERLANAHELALLQRELERTRRQSERERSYALARLM
ncbi:hypothetical protein [Protaetiibacter intestinalis]|uniref:Uncharacterized protein n=1 Tax=Protaetiibacter intestinalis TaxID=2419774 RepID=A0A387B7Z1_9MICO|nr:hypothetical protein [Protaetiibacter intestinalis]AYF98463.1 hypothetical protein D7I47_09480 [Protaetiibacter intestinalis]